jgi:hypothetical protein
LGQVTPFGNGSANANSGSLRSILTQPMLVHFTMPSGTCHSGPGPTFMLSAATIGYVSCPNVRDARLPAATR